HNVIAPGTHGYKTIRITNNDSTTSRGKTEVTYKLTAVDGAPPSATITSDTDSFLAGSRIKFAVLTNAATDSGTGVPTVNWTSGTAGTYLTTDASSTYADISWQAANAFSGYSGTNLGNINVIKDIVVLWKWDFEDTTESSSTYNEKETNLAKAENIPTISVSFGKIKAEQVD
ncbi:MAG: hypothetical protein LBS33_00065, partial [Streptococcaceae bacterium]|nr:hypothetical protein [Streptococcaceae bacterium]